MDREFYYSSFETCIAHFKENPPSGAAVDLDFTAEEIAYITGKASEYGCSVDIFLNAVLACFMGEDIRKKRDAAFQDAKSSLRAWVLAQAEKQDRHFEEIQGNPAVPFDNLVRAATALGYQVAMHMSEAQDGQSALLKVDLS